MTVWTVVAIAVGWFTAAVLASLLLHATHDWWCGCNREDER